MSRAYLFLAGLVRSLPFASRLLWRGRCACHALRRHWLVRKPFADGGALIRRAIEERRPFAAGKIGSVEARAMVVWRAREGSGAGPAYPSYMLHTLFVNAGVFPESAEGADAFGAVFSRAIQACDALVAWDVAGEAALLAAYAKQAQLIRMRSLEPYFSAAPWSAALAGRKVLVISPFVRTISAQYERRADVWGERAVLPDFELLTVRAPLSPALADTDFSSWAEALEDIKRRMDALDYDVALIGAGAYSLPLAAHAKERGKVGLHLGGALQILFGVVGQRWRERADFAPFINTHWAAPSGDEVPARRELVEGGCYW